MPKDVKSVGILVVDDIRFNISIISRMLADNGFNNVQFALSGREAVEKCKSFKPRVMLLDLILPDISGYEVCKILKSDPDCKDIRIIIQSAMTRPEQKREAFENGASDFINKPIDSVELVSRLTLQIEQLLLYEGLTDALSKMEAELRGAEDLVNSLLPSDEYLKELGNKYGISMGTHFLPSSYLGGDFYNTFPINDNKLGVYLWDYSGHGVIAAIHTLRLNSAMQSCFENSEHPGKFLSQLNNILSGINKIGNYATMFYGVIDIVNQVLEYAYASCPPPILISFSRQEMKLLDTKEFPLGIVKSHSYETQKVSLADWDALILYSDALVETANDSSHQCMSSSDLGMLALKYCSDDETSSSAIKIKNKIMQIFESNYRSNLNDDLTLSVFKFNHDKDLSKAI